MKDIGSNYNQLNSVLISKLGKGVFLAARRIGTGSDFEHAGGTPHPFLRRVPLPPPGKQVSSANIIMWGIPRKHKPFDPRLRSWSNIV